jgi:hypothetical protein
MRHKRLIACLLAIIFVGGVLVSTYFVFRVQHVHLSITTETTRLIVNKATAEVAIRQEVERVARNKNIIIGLNRTNIRDTIYATPGHGHLVRVKDMRQDIEAKFPNILQVRLEERQPMYRIVQSVQGGNQTVVMDYEFQILGCSATFTIQQMTTNEINNLIDITNEFSSLNPNFITAFKPGENLVDYISGSDLALRSILILMADIFFNPENFPDNQAYNEVQLCYLIRAISFDAERISNIMETEIISPPGSMFIVITDPRNPMNPSAPFLDGRILIEIRNYSEATLAPRLQAAWERMEVANYVPGIMVVYQDNTTIFNPAVGGG